MFSNQKITSYIFLFLGFCVLSSKSIIIYNEETLVAISFFCFVVFCFNYFGNTLRESLDERSSTIRSELQNFLNYKQESLTELSLEHKRVSQLEHAIDTVASFTKLQLSKCSSTGESVLRFTFAQQLQQKLGHLSSSRGTLQQRLQALIANDIQALVLSKIEQAQKAGNEFSLDTKIVKAGIEQLKKA